MKQSAFPLDQLPVGRVGIVKSLEADGNKRRRLLDLGLIPGTLVEMLQKSPAGDPVAYLIRGAVIALRGSEAAQIILEGCEYEGG